MAASTGYQNLKLLFEKAGTKFTPGQLVNHDFLRGLERSHVITARDPDGSA
jgi:hypothetical protein